MFWKKEARILDQIDPEFDQMQQGKLYFSIWFQNTKWMYKMDKPIGVPPLKKKKKKLKF